MKERRDPILRPVLFEVPLPEMKLYRLAAKARQVGVVRWLRNLANDDIKKLIEAGQIQDDGEVE